MVDEIVAPAAPPAPPAPPAPESDRPGETTTVAAPAASAASATSPASAATDGGDGEVTGTLARLRRDPFLLAAALLVLVPSITAAVSALRHPWIPTNDWALIELRVREVGTGDTPLVGAWSRFGWKHPGPLAFYVLAVPYRLVGADHGLLFATACVNLAATIGFALVVLRFRRTQAVVALFGLAMVQRGMGIDQLGDPWNPTILLVPFALYLVLCIEIAVGRSRWALPVAAGVASFVVQAHVGLVQPVALVGVVALGLRWWWGRAQRGSGGPLRARLRSWGTVPTAVVLGLAWLPPVIDQVDGTGNLGLLFRWARGDDIGGGMGALTEGRLGRGRALDAAAWLLDPIGLWVGRFQPIDGFGAPLLGQGRPVTLLWIPLVLGLAVLVLRRAPLRPADRRRAGVATAVALAGLVALATDLLTAEGSPVFWPFRWAAVVVMMVWIALGWAVAGAAVHMWPWLDEPVAGRWRGRWRWRDGASPRRIAGGAMAAAVALPVVLAVARGPVGRQPQQAASDAMLELRPALVEHAGRDGRVAANTTNLLNDKDLAVPVVLERAGIDWVDVSDPDAARVPRYMVVPADVVRNIPLLTAAIAVGEVEVLGRASVDGAELLLVRAAAGISTSGSLSDLADLADLTEPPESGSSGGP